jgi:DNA-directed RNA polymerase specialized sigma24 family protein
MVRRRARFETTEWSLVLAARGRNTPRAEDALAGLCERYWYPIYSFVRRQGSSAEEAEDLTQAFFTRILEKGYLGQVDRDRGRFRAFLLAACRHFLSNERDRVRALKRGGGRRLLSIDATLAEERLRLEPAHDLTPEKEYLRRWTLTVIDKVLASLRTEFAAKDKTRLFDALKGFLVGDASPDAYRRAAQELSQSEGALRVAVHRLRRQFRNRLRAEVVPTVEDAEAVEDELRSLLASLS